MKTIGVFCGAKLGNNPKIGNLTYEIGQTLALLKMRIVCGGSDCGLMGVLTNGALSQGGKVVGVFPNILINVETPHSKLERLIRTPSLPSRKQQMLDLCDGFLILPGGYGTLDEIFEVVVLRRLNANKKPIILFNYRGFYDCTLKQITKMVAEGFIGENEANLFTVMNDIESVQNYLKGAA